MADILTVGEFLAIIGIVITNRLGGPQEAYYRIRRLPYFIDYIRGPDRRWRKHIFPLSMIQHHSPAMYEYGRGNYLVPETEASQSSNGAPLYFHNWDDTRPIPTDLDSKMLPDGTVVKEYRDRIPPEVIKAGFSAKIAADIHRQGEQAKPSKLAWYIVFGLMIVVLIQLVNTYYGYNVNCALHTDACK